jgi:ornithine cyclodeaminase/alanine dehydrogenase-like protein (mu-crystallin family)
VERGIVPAERVDDLAPILVGRRPGRRSREERIFFSPVGLATSDVLIAWRVYRAALDRGVGQSIRMWAQPARH